VSIATGYTIPPPHNVDEWHVAREQFVEFGSVGLPVATWDSVIGFPSIADGVADSVMQSGTGLPQRRTNVF
jgi:hypothetical protein